MRITGLFLKSCDSDNSILRKLNKEQYVITSWELVQIRHELGLYQKLSLVNREEADEFMFDVVRKAFDTDSIPYTAALSSHLLVSDYSGRPAN